MRSTLNEQIRYLFSSLDALITYYVGNKEDEKPENLVFNRQIAVIAGKARTLIAREMYKQNIGLDVHRYSVSEIPKNQKFCPRCATIVYKLKEGCPKCNLDSSELLNSNAKP